MSNVTKRHASQNESMKIDDSTYIPLQDSKVELSAQHISPRETLRQKIEAEKKEDMRMVRAIFQNPRYPDQIVKFPYRKYKGQIDLCEFQHGEEYTVPMYMVNHINYEVGEQKYDGLLDTRGKLIPKGKKIPRFSFSIVSYVN